MNTSSTVTNLRIIKLNDVINKTGLPRSTVYYRVNQGEFPKPIKLGKSAKASGWLEHQVDEWILEQLSRVRDYK